MFDLFNGYLKFDKYKSIFDIQLKFDVLLDIPIVYNYAK